jgi:disulfide bond formation protein DsbB
MPRLSQIRPLAQPLPAAVLLLGAAVMTLAGAFVFQSLGVEPCELCLKERYAYYACLPLAAAAFFLARNARGGAAKLLLGLLAVIFASNAILGAYHAGVEWKFWPGPSDCTGDFVKPTSMADFRKQLQSVHVVRCDDASLRILGLSLAGWNAIVSAGLCLVAGLGATSPRK